MEYKNILVEIRNKIAIVRLNRPKALNALNKELMTELYDALKRLEKEVFCVVLTGNERAFAAGADIKEMAEETAVSISQKGQFEAWDKINEIKIPMIAAVSGYALGGGFELAMQCDMIIASETAVFGQPEIKLGIIPGAGGTQRLTRTVGKFRAMELILTGRNISAEEAYKMGVVNAVYSKETYLEEAVKLAEKIASMSAVAVRAAKETVKKAWELPLREGLEAERNKFYFLFASEDQKEGMQAFIEKRKPEWKNK